MSKAKPYILPMAIVLGLLFHGYSDYITWLVPYVIFLILLLNFTAVDMRKMPLNRLDVFAMLFQTFVSVGGYMIIRGFFGDEVLAQGFLIAVLCPVASAVVVVAAALGADRRTTTGYTIYGNLLVTVIGPIIFSFIGVRQDMRFIDSAWQIFVHIASVIALPCFLALVMQLLVPKVSCAISRFKDWTLVLWAFALLATLGQTIDYIFIYHEGNAGTIIWLAEIALTACVLQFSVGRYIGSRLGERIAGGQLFGQKNSAMGIWMASVYLIPLSSVVLAFYSIFQNLFNSWQLYRAGHNSNGS